MILFRFIFSVIFLLVEFFLSIPAIFYLIFSERTKSGFLERLGFIKQKSRSEVYLFAPSLGDVRSVLPIARLLKNKLSMSVTFMVQTHSGMAEALRCKITGSASFAPIDGFLQLYYLFLIFAVYCYSYIELLILDLFNFLISYDCQLLLLTRI